jgi:hypothetical protein
LAKSSSKRFPVHLPHKFEKKPWINHVERSEGFFVNFFNLKNWQFFPQKLAKLIEFALGKEIKSKKKKKSFFGSKKKQNIIMGAQ